MSRDDQVIKVRVVHLRVLIAFVIGCVITGTVMHFVQKKGEDDYSIDDDFDFVTYTVPPLASEEAQRIKEVYPNGATCEKTEKHPKGCAYSTLITKDDFVECALVLGESILATGSQYPLVALVTSKVSLRGIELLQKAGIIIEHIDELTPPPTASPHRENWKDTFNKLSLFGKTDYERFVYIDADSVVLSSMDQLFQRPGEFLSATDRHLCQHKSVPGMSSMVSVIWPSLETEKQLLDMFNHSNYLFVRGDQSLTEAVFAQPPHSLKLLPPSVSSFVFRCQCDDYYEEGWEGDESALPNQEKTPKSVHFTHWFRPHISANGVSVPLGLSDKAKDCAGVIYKRWEELWKAAIERQGMSQEEFLKETVRPHSIEKETKEEKPEEISSN